MYADNLKCVSRGPDLLLAAARFTTGYVRLVGQEPAPSKCVLLSTSREVRYSMEGCVFSQEGDQWSVRFDVRDLGGHLDTTFRGWSSTLAARVRLVISRLVVGLLESMLRRLLPCTEFQGGASDSYLRRWGAPVPGQGWLMVRTVPKTVWRFLVVLRFIDKVLPYVVAQRQILWY